ncbi:MAG: TVP38/TMEM64 family protein [Eubacterium sp.]
MTKNMGNEKELMNDVDNGNVKEQNNIEKTERGMNDRHKKIVSIIGFIIFLLFSALVGWFIGKPLFQYVDEPEQFKTWVSGYGMWGWLICIGMMVLQIVIAIIPGGALEIGAGYAFGTIEGSIICIIGSIIGCAIVFQFVRVFGVKLVEAFFSINKIRSLKFLHDEKKRDMLAFIIFLLPGTPKDLLSYFMGLTDMKLSRWLLISTVARTPAIVISAMGGDALGSKKYVMAIVVFVVTVIISIVGMIFYKKLCKRHENRKMNK